MQGAWQAHLEVVTDEEHSDVANEVLQQGAPRIILLVLAVQTDATLHQSVLSHEDLRSHRPDSLHAKTSLSVQPGKECRQHPPNSRTMTNADRF